MGYQLAFDSGKSKLTKNNFALGYSTGDFVLHTNVNDGQVNWQHSGEMLIFLCTKYILMIPVRNLQTRWVSSLINKTPWVEGRGLPLVHNGALDSLQPHYG